MRAPLGRCAHAANKTMFRFEGSGFSAVTDKTTGELLMTTKGIIASATLSCAMLAGAALAQAPDNQQKGGQAIPAQIEKKLKDQGYTTVQVVPGSFLVSARDSQGDPVTMIIGPHSTTMFVTLSGGETTGSGSDKDQMQKKR